VLIPIILCGGAGTRLWPVSRETHPKPFIRLADGDSLLQKTVKRALATGAKYVLTVTNRDYYFITRDEYSGLCAGNAAQFDFLLEPAARNTAPAIAAAAFKVSEQFGTHAVMLMMPADHVIQDTPRFKEAVAVAEQLASEGNLVTFGISPMSPETGFGYIETERVVGVSDNALWVRRFVEKPSGEKAIRYLSAGNYYWNSGMFCFQAGRLLEDLLRHAPQVYKAVEACWQATWRENIPVTLDAKMFAQVPDISIDYAVMEKADRIALVPARFDWSDIGSWKALSELESADSAGNRVSGEAITIDAHDCYIRSETRMVAAVGVESLIVVDTPDALLIVNRDQVQQVKSVVQQLNERGHRSTRFHRTVHRPWGTYTVLEEGPRFKIKRIVVKSGASLSLQYHNHRSEHWVVVSGMAKIVNGDNVLTLGADQSTYIPAGNVHRLSNAGEVDCVIIEVQSGGYLGEDDIVRLEDVYGRGGKKAIGG
jgi:mannose-1-phosphate guanylyltransferase/mannose-6-phosphate isomerase